MTDLNEPPQIPSTESHNLDLERPGPGNTGSDSPAAEASETPEQPQPSGPSLFNEPQPSGSSLFPEAQPSGSGLSGKVLRYGSRNSKRTKSSESGLSQKANPSLSKTSSPASDGSSKPHKPLHRGLSKLILHAVATSNRHSGLSLQALKKTIEATGYNMVKRKNYFKRVLLNLVTKGLLQKLKGMGASGSFEISKKLAKKMGRGQGKKKLPQKKEKVLKIGIAATTLAERGSMGLMDVSKKPQPKAK